MSNKKPSLAAIPKGQDRDMTVFLQSIKTVIDYLDKNGGGGGGTDTSTITGYVNRINEDQSKDINKTIDDKLDIALEVGNLLDLLNGAITESELFIELGKKIDKITVNETAISAETQQRIAALLTTNAGLATEKSERTDADGTINTRIDTNVAKTATNTAAIALETATRTNALSAQATQINAVVAKSNANAALIVDERNASTSRDNALSSRLTATEAATSAGAARIGKLETADVNNKEALATAKTELRAEFVDGGKIKDTRDDNQPPQWYYDNYPQQVAKEFKRTTTIGLTGSTYTYLETTVKWATTSGGSISQIAYTDDGKIYKRESTSNTNWRDWAQQENTAGSQARVDAAKLALNKLITANTAAINQESTARATAIGAVTQQVNTMQTTVNGSTASVQALSSTVDGLKANWTIKVEAGNVVGGIGLAAGGGTIDFIVRASKFAVAGVSGSTATPFIVTTSQIVLNGQTINPGVYIEDTFIRNGSIVYAKIGVAAVDTLTIKGDAVTVARSKERVTLTIGPNSSANLISNLTMDAMGGRVSVSFGFDILRQTESSSGGGSDVFIDIKRGNEVLKTIFYSNNRTREQQNFVGGDPPYRFYSYTRMYYSNISIINIIDIPPSGIQSYSVDIRTGRDYYEKAETVIDGAVIQLLGLKK